MVVLRCIGKYYVIVCSRVMEIINAGSNLDPNFCKYAKLSGLSCPKYNDCHAQKAQTGTNTVCNCWLDGIYHPQPDECNTDIDTAIGSINTASSLRMKSEKPGKGRKAED